MKREEQWALKARVQQIFRPGTPIDRYALFAGRTQQFSSIMRAVNQTGQHVVMFGERGVGKTSLSKVLVEVLISAGIDVYSPDNINCDGTDDFSTIWHKVFREMSYTMASKKMGFRGQEDIEQVTLQGFLPDKATPDDIRYLLSRLDKKAIIVIDEVDRIKTQTTKTLLADTIKNLSDHGIKTTLILIGVADSVDQLIEEHRSVERALVQVHMPRMFRDELYEILDKGQEADVTFDADAGKYIVQLSAGLPHYTHTLGLDSAEIAIDQHRLNVSMADVQKAIDSLVKKPGHLLSAYHRATMSSRMTLYSEVLLACALAEKNDLGYFTAPSIRRPLEKIMGKKYDIPAFSPHLGEFCTEKRGPVLERLGTSRRFQFRFINPLMQPFVILHGIAKGLLQPDILINDMELDEHSPNQE